MCVFFIYNMIQFQRAAQLIIDIMVNMRKITMKYLSIKIKHIHQSNNYNIQYMIFYDRNRTLSEIEK